MAISPGKLGEVLKAVLVRDLAGTPVSLHGVRRDGGAPDRRGRARRAGRARGDRPAARAASPGRHRPRCSSRPWSALRSPAVGPPGSAPPARRAWSSPSGCSSTAGGRSCRPRALAVAVGLSVVSWFFECLAFSLILDGLGVAPAAPRRDLRLRVRLARGRGVDAAGRPRGGGGESHGAPGGFGIRSPRRRPRPSSCGAPRCGSPSPSASYAARRVSRALGEPPRAT